MPSRPRADARHREDDQVTAIMSTRRAQAPRIRPVPRDPAARDHGWPGRWPLRSYLELPALDTAPGCARKHARAVLREWGLDTAGEEAALIVSEIVTNAMLTTQKHRLPSPVRMWMLSDGASVLFLAWDATMPAPVRRDAAPDAEHGRGLAIVEALSARWGWYHPDANPGDDQRPGGKVTWALIRPAAPARYFP
jgi:anti-sigma regulatory factor (Ser/Thr protein kinase)